MKPIQNLLRDAYYRYYQRRGNAPTSINVGEIYKDEFYESTDTGIVTSKNPLYVNALRQHYDIHGCFFMGIKLKWTKRRRIECLPRRRCIKFNKFVFPAFQNWIGSISTTVSIMPEDMTQQMPCLPVDAFYTDIKP